MHVRDGLLEKGDVTVITSGVPIGRSGTTKYVKSSGCRRLNTNLMGTQTPFSKDIELNCKKTMVKKKEWL